MGGKRVVAERGVEGPGAGTGQGRAPASGGCGPSLVGCGCPEEPAGEASVGRGGGRGTGLVRGAGNRGPGPCTEDRERGAKAGGGAGVGGPGRPVRGHCAVKGISARGRGPGVCGCSGAGGRRQAGGRAGSWRGCHRPRQAVRAPGAAGPREAASGGRAVAADKGLCEGPRGVSELASRGAQTPPRCQPRLRGGGRLGPPSASHRLRRRLPGLPGLPGPRNAAAAAGGAAWKREGAIAAGLCLASALLPYGGPCQRPDGRPAAFPRPGPPHRTPVPVAGSLGWVSDPGASASEWPWAHRLSSPGWALLLRMVLGVAPTSWRGGRGHDPGSAWRWFTGATAPGGPPPSPESGPSLP